MKIALGRGFSARLFAIASLVLMAGAMTGTVRAQSYGGGLAEATSVAFINRSGRTLYVAFSVPSGDPGPVVWSDGCMRYNNQVAVGAGQTCTASVPNSVGPSRFCATKSPENPGTKPNCYEAQRNNLTMIETNFTSGNGCVVNPCPSAAGCAPPTRMTCVWYDISVIPQNCTNCEWIRHACKSAGAGLASYNVPLQLSCTGSTTFTCRGPADRDNFPTNCGTTLNPQAFFFPMSGECANNQTSRPQPLDRCPQGQTLVVTFLEGP